MSPSITMQTYPSRTVKGFCDKPPVWRFCCGSFYVLHHGDDVGGSATCGSVGDLRLAHGSDDYVRSAMITIPGTKECQGAFGLLLGRFRDVENAKNCVEAAVAERHADPATYDAAARIADRQRVSLDVARRILAVSLAKAA